MTSEKGIFFNKRIPTVATLKKTLVKLITLKQSLSSIFSFQILFFYLRIVQQSSLYKTD